MTAQTIEALARDQRVLAALKDGPKTTGEITRLLQREVWQTWADVHGYEITWDDYGMPSEPMVRLLAHTSALALGLVTLNHGHVYSRLVKFERQDLIRRFALPGRKSIMWTLKADKGEAGP